LGISFTSLFTCSSAEADDFLGIFVAPLLPAFVGEFVVDPFGNVGRWVEGLHWRWRGASVAKLDACAWLSLPVEKMVAAKVQPASFITAVRLATADVRQAPVNLLRAAWVIALGRNAITNVAIPR
jgi:hypothetical protein